MNSLLNLLEKIPQFKQLLRKTCKSNQLPITILNGFSCDKIISIYQRLIKHYEQHHLKGKTLWFQNQLKIFFWILIIWSLVNSKLIHDFNDDDWNQIKQIFTVKDIYTFKYEAKRILSSGRKNSRVWNHQQNQLLQKIMSDKDIKNKWNEVARMFYELSNHKHFRTGKQCREHWLNHLDPSKKHGKWSRQEDFIILKYVFSNGKKWSCISKDFLLHRTEHMIKNRFKSLIFKQKKKNALDQVDELKIVKKILKKNKQSLPPVNNGEVISQDQSQKDGEGGQIQLNNGVQVQNKMNAQPVQLSICPPLNNMAFPFYTPFYPFNQNLGNFYHIGYGENIMTLQNNRFLFRQSQHGEMPAKIQNDENFTNFQLSKGSNFVWVRNENPEVYCFRHQA